MLAVLGVAVLWSGYSWWRAWSAPLIPVVFRPAFSVEGISSGTPVRVQGVTVGQVSSIGLDADAEGRLRPVVRLVLDPATLEDRGFADRLRGDRLRTEVAQGLRARLVAVSPASGMLQVELIWDAAAALASFSASLEGSQTRMNAASAEFSALFRAVSEAARTWSKKAAGLTTEPRPR